TFRLLARENDKWRMPSIGQLARSFVVGAVHSFKDGQRKLAVTRFEQCFDESGVQVIGFSREPVAAGFFAFKIETLRTEFFHVLPYGHAAHAEFFGQSGAGNITGGGTGEFA